MIDFKMADAPVTIPPDLHAYVRTQKVEGLVAVKPVEFTLVKAEDKMLLEMTLENISEHNIIWRMRTSPKGCTQFNSEKSGSRFLWPGEQAFVHCLVKNMLSFEPSEEKFQISATIVAADGMTVDEIQTEFLRRNGIHAKKFNGQKMYIYQDLKLVINYVDTESDLKENDPVELRQTIDSMTQSMQEKDHKLEQKENLLASLKEQLEELQQYVGALKEYEERFIKHPPEIEVPEWMLKYDRMSKDSERDRCCPFEDVECSCGWITIFLFAASSVCLVLQIFGVI